MNRVIDLFGLDLTSDTFDTMMLNGDSKRLYSNIKALYFLMKSNPDKSLNELLDTKIKVR